MATRIDASDAAIDFSALLERVLAGEEIIIAKAGTPVARLTALNPTASGPRVPGSRAGKLWMAEDFDEPLADDFLSSDSA